MDTATSTERALGLPPGSRGKNGGEREELKVEPIRKGLVRLARQYSKMLREREAFAELAKELGASSNCRPALLKRLVRVSHAGNLDKARQERERERELFDQVGEDAAEAFEAAGAGA